MIAPSIPRKRSHRLRRLHRVSVICGGRGYLRSVPALPTQPTSSHPDPFRGYTPGGNDPLTRLAGAGGQLLP